MASNAASSVQFRVNGTEMARGRTRKTERSQSMDPRAKPRAAGRLKGKRRNNRDEREFILGPENAGNFCIARRSRGISAIVSRRLPRSRLLAHPPKKISISLVRMSASPPSTLPPTKKVDWIVRRLTRSRDGLPGRNVSNGAIAAAKQFIRPISRSPAMSVLFNQRIFPLPCIG